MAVVEVVVFDVDFGGFGIGDVEKADCDFAVSAAVYACEIAHVFKHVVADVVGALGVVEGDAAAAVVERVAVVVASSETAGDNHEVGLVGCRPDEFVVADIDVLVFAMCRGVHCVVARLWRAEMNNAVVEVVGKCRAGNLVVDKFEAYQGVGCSCGGVDHAAVSGEVEPVDYSVVAVDGDFTLDNRFGESAG